MVKYQMIDCEKCDLVYKAGSKHICSTECQYCGRYYKINKKHICRYTNCQHCGKGYRIERGHDDCDARL
jgi:hypothetical protein